MGRGKPKHVTNFGRHDIYIAFLDKNMLAIDKKIHLLSARSGSVGEIPYPTDDQWYYLYIKTKVLKHPMDGSDTSMPIQVLAGDDKAYTEFHCFYGKAEKDEDGNFYDVHVYKYRRQIKNLTGITLEMPDDIEVDDPPPPPIPI